MDNLNRPILSDRDRDVIEKYDNFREPTDPSEMADYIRAVAKMIVATAQEDSYEMGQLLRMNGMANDVEQGNASVSEAKDWMRDLDVSNRVRHDGGDGEGIGG